MADSSSAGSAPRRIWRSVRLGLMYIGANVWPCAEVYLALRTAAADAAAEAAARRREREEARRAASPEGVTPYAELDDAERRVLAELERQFAPQSEQ